MFFSSRGSNLDATDYDMNGIELFQDELPVMGADGNNHNRVLDPLGARFATVARGANWLEYGASTLGGAIDFVSPTAHVVDDRFADFVNSYRVDSYSLLDLRAGWGSSRLKPRRNIWFDFPVPLCCVTMSPGTTSRISPVLKAKNGTNLIGCWCLVGGAAQFR